MSHLLTQQPSKCDFILECERDKSPHRLCDPLHTGDLTSALNCGREVKSYWGIKVMYDRAIEIDQVEHEILTREFSDEALEGAAGSRGGMEAAYTLYWCTALALCPGP